MQVILYDSFRPAGGVLTSVFFKGYAVKGARREMFPHCCFASPDVRARGAHSKQPHIFLLSHSAFLDESHVLVIASCPFFSFFFKVVICFYVHSWVYITNSVFQIRPVVARRDSIQMIWLVHVQRVFFLPLF